MVNVIRKPFVIPAVVCAVVIVWVLIWSFNPIVNGHWSYLAFYGGFLLVSLAAIGWAFWKPDGKGRLWLSVPGSVALILAAIGAFLLAPFGATDVALDAMASSSEVTVVVTGSSIAFEPEGGSADIGLVFQPGARVDSRAYAHILRPLAEAGHRVVIVKQPLGIAFFATGFAASWAEDHPETEWAVGGHSLGGVVAALNVEAAQDLNRLVLWASFPSTDISGETGLGAISIYGTNDGLSTPLEIDESAADLPAGTVFVAVEGAVHSQFGNYGDQPRDGDPTISTQEAQAEIVSATLAFLSS